VAGPDALKDNVNDTDDEQDEEEGTAGVGRVRVGGGGGLGRGRGVVGGRGGGCFLGADGDIQGLGDGDLGTDHSGGAEHGQDGHEQNEQDVGTHGVDRGRLCVERELI